MTLKKPVFEEEPENKGGIALPAGTKDAEAQSIGAVQTFVKQVPKPVIIKADQVAFVMANQKRADEGIKYINGLFKECRDAAEESKRKAEASRKALVTLIEKITQPLVDYRESCIIAIRAWNLSEEKRLREIAAKEKADADAKAAELEKKGDVRGAEMVRDFAPVPETVKYVPPVKQDQRIYGKKYKARVVNLYALCNAIAERVVLADAVTANQVWLNKEAENHKGQNPPPGVEFYEE